MTTEYPTNVRRISLLKREIFARRRRIQAESEEQALQYIEREKPKNLALAKKYAQKIGKRLSHVDIIKVRNELVDKGVHWKNYSLSDDGDYKVHILLWIDHKAFKNPIASKYNQEQPEKVSLAEFCEMVENTEGFTKLQKVISSEADIGGFALQALPVSGTNGYSHIAASQNRDIGYALVATFAVRPISNPIHTFPGIKEYPHLMEPAAKVAKVITEPKRMVFRRAWNWHYGVL